MKGWYVLAAFVAGYDTFANVTLSTQFREGVRRHPVPITLATAYIVFHLYGVIPPKLDPLRSLGAYFGK